MFVSVWGLSLVEASGGHSSSRCAGLSLSRPLLLRSTGSRHTGSVVVAYGSSCSAACGIFPDQGSNLCPLHWQAGSQPLRHQGSPWVWFLNKPYCVVYTVTVRYCFILIFRTIGHVWKFRGSAGGAVCKSGVLCSQHLPSLLLPAWVQWSSKLRLERLVEFPSFS